MRNSETVNHRPSVSLTGLGVHVSMNLYEFSMFVVGIGGWYVEVSPS